MSSPSTNKSKPDPLIGRTFAGGFRIEECIGTGGMGSVYRALDRATRANVAIKVLSQRLAGRADLRKRFEREARALVELSHPNTVRVLDYGVEKASGSLFIVMELLEGKTLSQHVQMRGPLPVDEALGIITKVCYALEEAHKKGIVHRDLKPENIFLCGPDLEPKLLDFGLAKLGESLTRPGSLILTQEGMVFGTPEFMSPEQAQGHTLDARSDVYSLSVILYEALTGKLPFDSKTSMEFVRDHVLETPIALSARVSDRQFPEGLDAIVARALAKRRSERQQSAGELGDSLARLLALHYPAKGAEVDSARRESAGPSQAAVQVAPRTPRRRRATRSRRTVFSLAVVGVLLLLAAAVQMYVR